jgi:hypothetical protein
LNSFRPGHLRDRLISKKCLPAAIQTRVETRSSRGGAGRSNLMTAF